MLLTPPLNDLISNESFWRTLVPRVTSIIPPNTLCNQARERRSFRFATYFIANALTSIRIDRRNASGRGDRRVTRTRVERTHARDHAAHEVAKRISPATGGYQRTSPPGFHAFKIKYPAARGPISSRAIAQLKRNCWRAARARERLIIYDVIRRGAICLDRSRLLECHSYEGVGKSACARGGPKQLISLLKRRVNLSKDVVTSLFPVVIAPHFPSAVSISAFALHRGFRSSSFAWTSNAQTILNEHIRVYVRFLLSGETGSNSQCAPTVVAECIILPAYRYRVLSVVAQGTTMVDLREWYFYSFEAVGQRRQMSATEQRVYTFRHTKAR